jgi:hypothetical protein
MKNLLWSLLFILPSLAMASEIKPYEWDRSRGRFTLTNQEKANAELFIKQHVQHEYVLEDDQFLMYSTIHKIILVNSNEAIQKHNRIIISMNSTLDLVDLKARSISKDGKVVNFDMTNLKELKDEAGDKSYRIFAIEGIELGSEIEYYFTRKMYANLFDRVFVQNDAPIKNSSFLLSCPKHLKFEFKSYLGYPPVKEESAEERNVYTVSMADIEGLKEEPFSYFSANRKRIEFKLAYNTARAGARLYTWDDAAKNFYTRLTSLTKDEEKSLEKYFKSLGDNAAEKIDVRIKNIEQKIKTTVQVDKEGKGGEATGQINSILKYKIASREGITRLMVAVFNKANIATHVVLTCSREDVPFDGSFDTWGYLDDYILYFPATKGFVAPYHFEQRYPFVPHELTSQNGLFIEPFVMGEVKSGLASIQHIPAMGSDVSYDNLVMDVKFSSDLSQNLIVQKRSFGGYNAAYLTPYYPMMSKEDQQNMVDNITKQTAPDAKITRWTAKPFANGINDDFLIDVDFSSSHFLEKAGPRLLFKVGELIGPQTEMYRDDKRTTLVQNDFNRLYDRKITVTIPDGYVIKNPEVLNFNVLFKDKEKTSFAFVSKHEIKGQVLEIVINEFYREIEVPVSRYEDFRKVVNAAADFNKVTLVLEKRK